MKAVIENSEWTYKVCVIFGNAWQDRRYTGITYTEKKDAIKALEYHGKGYVEASRQVKYTYPYDGTRYGCESKKIYELN